MDLLKQYIIQSISVASNNLRLNPQKIEVVALLRESIMKSDDLGSDIKSMKKITELSTLAIRLNEVYNYLTQGQLDFFKLSEKFKEHSQYLIKDLNHMLDMADPYTFKQALNKLNAQYSKNENLNNTSFTEKSKDKSGDDDNNVIDVDLSKRKTTFEFEKDERDKLKEEIILSDDKNENELLFQNFEDSILEPIKPLDALLKNLVKNQVSPDELKKFADIMERNAQISAKIGFDIISNMHKIISKSLLLIRGRELMPGKEIIESMRACMIVIVAVVKGKEVDITNYLNKAEEFGRTFNL